MCVHLCYRKKAPQQNYFLNALKWSKLRARRTVSCSLDFILLARNNLRDLTKKENKTKSVSSQSQSWAIAIIPHCSCFFFVWGFLCMWGIMFHQRIRGKKEPLQSYIYSCVSWSITLTHVIFDHKYLEIWNDIFFVVTMSGGCYMHKMRGTQKCSRIQHNALSFTNATVVLLGEKND